MAFYPINLNLLEKKCLVVGAGSVAERKIKQLLRFGAEVIVVSPRANKNIQILNKNKRIVYKKCNYSEIFLKDIFLVIAATNDNSVNRSVAASAARKNILCNVVDEPQLCNFYVPAIIKRGPLVVGVSTGGQSPAAAKWLRKKLGVLLGRSLGGLIANLGRARKLILALDLPARKKKIIYRDIIDKTLGSNHFADIESDAGMRK